MLQEMSARLSPFEEREHTVHLTPAPVTAAPAQAPVAPAAAGVQRAGEPGEMAARPYESGDQPSGRSPYESLWPDRPSEIDLERMARWLYPIISYRLRSELRDGRIRSGGITDSYQRW
jgi:hypothetical protein